MEEIQEAVVKSNTHQVDQFDTQGYTFFVRETINYREG